MSDIPLTPQLRAEYDELFRTCSLRPKHRATVESLAGRIVKQRGRYEGVCAPLGIPWQVVGAIHCMETGLRFDRHLHNGDPLSARTVHVPANRPAQGEPPFRWEDSARDALIYDGMDRRTDWSLAATLHGIEGYNGWGYRRYHPGVLSPYLWSYTTHYTRGKYVADGTWDADAVSRQCGAAALLFALAEQASFAVVPSPPPPPRAAAPGAPLIPYYVGGPESEAARRLQALLNELTGAGLEIDGKPGANTSDALEQLVGHKLVGDPRA